MICLVRPGLFDAVAKSDSMDFSSLKHALSHKLRNHRKKLCTEASTHTLLKHRFMEHMYSPLETEDVFYSVAILNLLTAHPIACGQETRVRIRPLRRSNRPCRCHHSASPKPLVPAQTSRTSSVVGTICCEGGTRKKRQDLQAYMGLHGNMVEFMNETQAPILNLIESGHLLILVSIVTHFADAFCQGCPELRLGINRNHVLNSFGVSFRNGDTKPV